MDMRSVLSTLPNIVLGEASGSWLRLGGGLVAIIGIVDRIQFDALDRCAEHRTIDLILCIMASRLMEAPRKLCRIFVSWVVSDFLSSLAEIAYRELGEMIVPYLSRNKNRGQEASECSFFHHSALPDLRSLHKSSA